MLEEADRSIRTDVRCIDALFRAVGRGDADNVVALVHADVVWLPMTRPGRSVYSGHAGTRDMVESLIRTLGHFRVEFDEFVDQPDGRILARGDIFRQTPDGEVGAPRFECLVTFQDGLVIGVDSEERPE
jgi:ketosteroid isomerase-like protein